MKMWLPKKTHKSRASWCRYKILLLFTFVTVKQKTNSYWVILCYKVALEHWQQGRVSKFFWVRMGYELKRKYEPFLFDFFIACNFKQFHFLLLHGSVCVKGSHRANNGKQRTRLPGDLSFIKTSSHKGHIRLKLVIIMIRLNSAK